MIEHLEVELDPQPGWYAVPEDRDEVPGWSQQLVRELAGPEADEDAVRGSAEVVRMYADAAHDEAVEVAWVLLPDPLQPVVAACHVELLFGQAGDLPSTDGLVAALAAAQPQHLGEPDVGVVTLPAGRAVRQHVLSTDDDGGVVESVVHVLRVEGLDDALVRMSTLWRSVALGDTLVAEADRMAAGLVLRGS